MIYVGRETCEYGKAYVPLKTQDWKINTVTFPRFVLEGRKCLGMQSIYTVFYHYKYLRVGLSSQIKHF